MSSWPAQTPQQQQTPYAPMLRSEWAVLLVPRARFITAMKDNSEDNHRPAKPTLSLYAPIEKHSRLDAPAAAGGNAHLLLRLLSSSYLPTRVPPVSRINKSHVRPETHVKFSRYTCRLSLALGALQVEGHVVGNVTRPEFATSLVSTTIAFCPAPYSAYTPTQPILSKYSSFALATAFEKPDPIPNCPLPCRRE